MSRAEERALEAHPSGEYISASFVSFCRRTFINGYEQAEKDVKNALMKWAKQKQYESLTIVADNFWQEVIDKLNQL